MVTFIARLLAALGLCLVAVIIAVLCLVFGGIVWLIVSILGTIFAFMVGAG